MIEQEMTAPPNWAAVKAAAALVGICPDTLPSEAINHRVTPPVPDLMTDLEWSIIWPSLSPVEKCKSAVPDRLFMDAALWTARNGPRWSLLPAMFRPVEAIRKKIDRFSVSGAWDAVFDTV